MNDGVFLIAMIFIIILDRLIQIKFILPVLNEERSLKASDWIKGYNLFEYRRVCVQKGNSLIWFYCKLLMYLLFCLLGVFWVILF